MKKNLFRIIQKAFIVLLILSVCLINSTQAIMVKLSLSFLTNEAEAIIIGEVENVQCEWSVDRQIILSVATVRIQEILKGDLYSSRILVQYPGGKIGELSLKVSDMPSFEMKERILVFLKPIVHTSDTKSSLAAALNLYPAFTLFGSAQGKYSIDRNGIATRREYNLISKEDDPDSSQFLNDLKTKIYNYLRQSSKEKAAIHEEGKH